MASVKGVGESLKPHCFGSGVFLLGLVFLGSDIASLHVARQGRKGRHLLVFRTHEQDGVIEVLRILHDSMDLARYLDS